MKQLQMEMRQWLVGFGFGLLWFLGILGFGDWDPFEMGLEISC